MAEKTIKIEQILLKGGTTEQWASTSYILKEKEPGYDTTLGLLKIGNGVDKWEDLKTTHFGDGVSVDVVDGAIKLVGFGENYTDKDGNSVAFDAGLQLTTIKETDGTIKLAWMKPDTSTADGAAAAVEALDQRVTVAEGVIEGHTSDISGINAKIGTVAEGQNLATMISDVETALSNADTTLSGRIKTIEDDYLKSSDKELIEGAIDEIAIDIEAIDTKIGDVGADTTVVAMISDAEESAVNRILGYLATEEINESYDTLKEVAAWIESDTTASAQLVTRVTDIENDYLKGADKTELSGKIEDLENFVGALPESAVSTTVVAYIQEVIDSLKIGDYAKASDLTTLAGSVDGINTTVNTHIANGDIHVTTEDKAKWNNKADAATTIAGYGITDAYTKTEVDTHTNNGDIHVTADEKVVWNGLPAALAKKVAGVKVAGTALVMDADGNVNIGIASANNYGVVKSNAVENGVVVDENGLMTVNSVNITKVVTDGVTLILDGGSIA